MAPVKPRILVLGASGFIGRRVIRALEESRRFEPVAVSRHASRSFSGRSLESHDVDVTSSGSLVPLMAGAAAVVNCVATAPASILSGTRALLDSMHALGTPPRIVHLSSLAAYGSAQGTVDESCPLKGDLGEYSAAKASTDEWVMGCPSAVILRPGIVFGPSSAWWSDRIARLLVSRRLGDLGPAGRGICNLVYVDDVAAAAVLALDLDASFRGAFNLASPVPITWNEYFIRYAHALGVSHVPLISPARLRLESRVLSLPLKVLESLLGQPALARWNPLPPIRPWLTELCARTATMDVTRAERILGVRWTPLDGALETTATWFRGGGRSTL